MAMFPSAGARFTSSTFIFKSYLKMTAKVYFSV